MKFRTHPAKKFRVISSKDGSISFKKWVFFNSRLYLEWNIDPKSLWKRPRKDWTSSREAFLSFRQNT